MRIGTTFNDDIAEEVNYVLDDHLGSSNARLDDLGSIIDRQEFYPFGDTSLRTYSFKRYQYVGKEKDAESGLIYYGARYYNSWACRFVSCDPAKEQRNWLTSYNYVQNNPINLTDPTGALDDGGGEENGDNSSNTENPEQKGEAWKHKNLWNDVIVNASDKKKYGDGFEEGKTTYKDLYEKRAPEILERKLDESENLNTTIDCADLVIETLVEFASYYGLPVVMKDFRYKDVTYDSKSTTAKSANEFSSKLKSAFGAATLFSKHNTSLKDVNWSDAKSGDVLTWKYEIFPWENESNRNWHASTISEITNNSITVIQGSLEDGEATRISKKSYDRDSKGKVDPSFWTSMAIDEVKVRRWNFNLFDK